MAFRCDHSSSLVEFKEWNHFVKFRREFEIQQHFLNSIPSIQWLECIVYRGFEDRWENVSIFLGLIPRAGVANGTNYLGRGIPLRKFSSSHFLSRTLLVAWRIISKSIVMPFSFPFEIFDTCVYYIVDDFFFGHRTDPKLCVTPIDLWYTYTS